MPPTIASLGLDKLDVEDRIRLMHELYESIPSKAECFELTDQEKLELDQEIEDCRQHPELGVSWAEAQKHLNSLRNK